uniref:Tubulin gamma chain n=1 Tax=Arcella intermedia TaxID=1963864 RepID=A0A6B2L3W9_9EUKA
MPKEIVTLQVGQCGNQIGCEYWKRICYEHGIGVDGVTQQNSIMGDRKDIFFSQVNENKYAPRALLFDLESTVLEKIQKSDLKSLFHVDSYWHDKEGLGAANNWASGYTQAESRSEEIFELIDRQVESCDNMEAFTMIHSISGGTGSGMGSCILEQLGDRYPKTLIQTYSVFPQVSDVVVQPYNSILTLKRLINNADSVVILDNAFLQKTAMEQLHMSNPSYTEINDLISTVMAAATSTFRFPESTNTDMMSLIDTLIPSPKLHFLISSYHPFSLFSAKSQQQSQSSVMDVMTRLLQPKNMLVSTPIDKGVYIGIKKILFGDFDPLLIRKSMQRIRQKEMCSFIPWGPARFEVTRASRGFYSLSNKRVEGLMIANHTSIRYLLVQCGRNYDKLRNVGAFVDSYRNFGNMFSDSLDEFDDSRNVVTSLIEEYKAAQTPSYDSFLVNQIKQ